MKWKIGDFDAAGVLSALHVADLQISKFMNKEDIVARVQELRCSVQHQALRDEHGLPSEIADLARRPGVLEWEWKD